MPETIFLSISLYNHSITSSKNTAGSTHFPSILIQINLAMNFVFLSLYSSSFIFNLAPTFVYSVAQVCTVLRVLESHQHESRQ